MSDLTFSEQVDRLLETSARDTALSPALAQLHRELHHARERLQQPMRVAIVGLIKAGKSTAMNALLGEDVVPTGTIETTFNVNWLCFHREKSLEVHFKDNRAPETRPFAELGNLTRRVKDRERFLLSIKYIKVFFPNEILNTLQLVDTPGLESVHEQDSQKTLDFIKAHGHELTGVTQAEAKQADAVLYLFSQSISASVEKIIEEFQGPSMGDATPINSIGTLTRVDAYWPSERDAPLIVGERVAKRLREHPRVQRSLYTILPINGLLGLGAQTLTPSEFETLKQLAELPPGKLRSMVISAEKFVKDTFEGVTVSPDQREALYNRIRQYGTWRACELIRAGVDDIQQLKQELYEESGLAELRKLILSHFGNRAFLIKLESVLRALSTTIFHLRSKVTGNDLETLKKISWDFEKLSEQQGGLKELQVLRAYYEGKLSLSEGEVQQLLQITGENGTTYWQRLGIQEEEGIPTETRLEREHDLAQARMLYWRHRLLDPELNRETRIAARTIERAYERTADRIQEALRYLTFT